jgi:hypothetical protein
LGILYNDDTDDDDDDDDDYDDYDDDNDGDDDDDDTCVNIQIIIKRIKIYNFSNNSDLFFSFL